MARKDAECQRLRRGGALRGPLIVVAVLGVCGLVLIVVCLGLIERPPELTDADRLLSRAKKALDQQNFLEAEKLARASIREGTELAAGAWIIAGEATAQQERFEDAIACFLEVVAVSERTDEKATAYTLAADVFARRLYQLGDAERHYRQALAVEPNQDNAQRGLISLLVAEGRRREAADVLLDVVKVGRATDEHLFLLGNSEWVVETLSFKTRAGQKTILRSDLLERALEAVPGDKRPAIGLARLADIRNHGPEAIALLRDVLAGDADLHEARGMLGQLLAQAGDAGEFLAWHADVPAAAENEPKVWFARATWARRLGRHDVAARCCWECLKEDPNHVAANLQLAQALVRIGRQADAVGFRKRAALLSELVTLLRGLSGDSRLGDARTETRLKRVVILNRELGRPWEAVAWSLVALKQNSRLSWPKEQLKALDPHIKKKNTPHTLKSFTPLAQVDLSSLPAPDWSATAPVDGNGPRAADGGFGPVTFRDDAGTTGLAFRYYNDASEPYQQSRLPETIGGGAGVLDLDRDGFPDLYLAQGSRWPRRETKGRPTRFIDRMFWNVGGERFQDVTLQAGLAETGYGQGVSIGDVNADGFPDVHVTNIGGNRLLINNGDGTFSDATDAAGIAGDQWSVSSLLADLDGDSLPDLYVVNYLAGDDVFAMTCPPGTRSRRPCGPGDFEAAQDRLFLNDGRGGFRDVTMICGLVKPQGKGLGVVAADFTGSGRLDLFIANDTRPNFLFENRRGRPPATLSLKETAMFAGLAVSAEGEPEGCMGIAVGDVDGDGRLDLFITNYIGQSNTLYSPLPAAAGTRDRGKQPAAETIQFFDRTRAAGLFDAGFTLVGWGTEFLDADLDGDLDLLVANGHLWGHVRAGEMLEMPPLFYRNSGKGHFEPLPAAGLGEYFTRRTIGRGLARIDWNRDGREDAVITHIDQPLALLTNTTSRTGHFLALRLVGTESERDAIGATVTATAGGQSWISQLTAGDGFLVSNQKRLVLGLGPVTTLERLTIRWPSGREQELVDIAVDRELVIVEGRGAFAVGGE